MSHTERSRIAWSRHTARGERRTARRRAGRATGITLGILAIGLLLLGTEARAQYYSAMILPVPGLNQEGVAYALGKFGGGAPVVGSTWRTASSSIYYAARFDGPYDLHPYPLVGPNPYVNSITWATTSFNGQTRYAGIAGFKNNPNDPNESPKQHAFLWNESNQSYVDLHPPGFFDSQAYGTAGGIQVGIVWEGGSRAARWSGTAASFKDMNPPGTHDSQIRGTDGTFHVGNAAVPVTYPGGKVFFDEHALLWTDSGATFTVTDLHPTGAVPSLTGSQTFLFSVALAVDNGQQVGLGSNSHGGFPDEHALLWNGTSASTQDLHPTDPHYLASAAYGLSNNVAAGVGLYSTNMITGSDHALAWRGVQAANLFDLHNVLPAGYVESVAYGVGVYGDVVGYAQANSGIRVPVRWMYRPKVTKPPYEIGPREEFFPVSRRRGEGFIITEVRMPKEGGIVKMTSEVPSIVSVPDSVRIGGQEDAALFVMTFAKEGTYPQGTVKNVRVRATYNGIIREAIVKVVF